MNIELCTMYVVCCTLYSIQYYIYNVSTMYSMHCTTYNIQRTLYKIRYSWLYIFTQCELPLLRNALKQDTTTEEGVRKFDLSSVIIMTLNGSSPY